MRVVAAKRLKAKLSVHEDDGVSGLEEVLGGRRPASAWPDERTNERTTVQGRSMALESDPPALKLSRKRTLHVS